MVDDFGLIVGFDKANVVQRRVRLLGGTRPMSWLYARRTGGRRIPVMVLQPAPP
ncbi:MAG TPA: hypothetical protein VFE92_04815 [Dermatophilaceae bacterium]|nr:hypothetical protein [Dermatophilaceae bacterium]